MSAMREGCQHELPIPHQRDAARRGAVAALAVSIGLHSAGAAPALVLCLHSPFSADEAAGELYSMVPGNGNYLLILSIAARASKITGRNNSSGGSMPRLNHGGMKCPNGARDVAEG